MTLSLEGLAHHVELLTRLALLEPITLARHHVLVALRDREDWPEEEGDDQPSRFAADEFLRALCDAAGDGPDRDPAFPARDEVESLRADIIHLAHVVSNHLADMKKTAAANARSRHLSNRSNLPSSAAPGQGLNDSTAAERKERRLRILIDARVEHVHAYGGLSFEPIRREDQADLETTKLIWEASAGPCPILPEFDSLTPCWATSKAAILERNKQNNYCGKYKAYPEVGMPPTSLLLREFCCVMRGAAVAWTFGPDSKDAAGELIRPHVTYCELDRVGYGVAPDTYVTCAARWSLVEQLVADLTKRCLTRGTPPRQTFELIRRIYSDLSSRLTNGGKVITLKSPSPTPSSPSARSAGRGFLTWARRGPATRRPAPPSPPRAAPARAPHALAVTPPVPAPRPNPAAPRPAPAALMASACALTLAPTTRPAAPSLATPPPSAPVRAPLPTAAPGACATPGATTVAAATAPTVASSIPTMTRARSSVPRRLKTYLDLPRLVYCLNRS